jgi:hypothetical protein
VKHCVATAKSKSDAAKRRSVLAHQDVPVCDGPGLQGGGPRSLIRAYASSEGTLFYIQGRLIQ